MKKCTHMFLLLVLLFQGTLRAEEEDLHPVNINKAIAYVDTVHNGKKIRISRIQDDTNIIPLDYAITSRPCPPYCIQPMHIAEGVETVGELEVLDYLKRVGEGDPNLLVIDTREQRWIANGMIPGAVHMPWTLFHSSTATSENFASILEFEFGVIPNGRLWDFNAAKTLVFYCNGPWCGQSPTVIRALLTAGYPARLIKWYRGGMQSWLQFGLTIVDFEGNSD